MIETGFIVEKHVDFLKSQDELNPIFGLNEMEHEIHTDNETVEKAVEVDNKNEKSRTLVVQNTNIGEENQCDYN